MKLRLKLFVGALGLMMFGVITHEAWSTLHPEWREWLISEFSHPPGNSWPRPNTRGAGESGHFGDRLEPLWHRLSAAYDGWLSIPPEERVHCRPLASRGEPLSPACHAWLARTSALLAGLRKASAANHVGPSSPQTPMRCSEEESTVPLSVASLALAFSVDEAGDDPAAAADACLDALSFARDALWWSELAVDDSRNTVALVAGSCLKAALETRGEERARFAAALGRIREGEPPMTLSVERLKLRLLVYGLGNRLLPIDRARLPADVTRCINLMAKRPVAPLARVFANDDDWQLIVQFWAAMEAAARAPRSQQRELFTRTAITPPGFEGARADVVDFWQQMVALDTLLDALDEALRGSDAYRETGSWPAFDGGVDWELTGQPDGTLHARVDSHVENFTLTDGGQVVTAIEWTFRPPDAGER